MLKDHKLYLVCVAALVLPGGLIFLLGLLITTPTG